MEPIYSGIAGEILQERGQQMQREGWSPEHDDTHTDGSLALAGAAYAMSAGGQVLGAEQWWPWEREGFKPKNARRDLIRAAALLVAEIERLDRAECVTSEDTSS